jgi:type I restriction enzyme, S subunit
MIGRFTEKGVLADVIAYNMMRMWQGASEMAEHDAIVSPAYVVLAPTSDIDPLFASYWFKSPRMIYLFWPYSYGIAGRYACR